MWVEKKLYSVSVTIFLNSYNACVAEFELLFVFTSTVNKAYCIVLQSLSMRNKQLLSDKKALLIQNKVEFDRLEKQKVKKTLPSNIILFYQLLHIFVI